MVDGGFNEAPTNTALEGLAPTSVYITGRQEPGPRRTRRRTALPHRRRRTGQPPQTRLRPAPQPPERRRRPPDLGRMGASSPTTPTPTPPGAVSETPLTGRGTGEDPAASSRKDDHPSTTRPPAPPFLTPVSFGRGVFPGEVVSDRPTSTVRRFLASWRFLSSSTPYMDGAPPHQPPIEIKPQSMPRGGPVGFEEHLRRLGLPFASDRARGPAF